MVVRFIVCAWDLHQIKYHDTFPPTSCRIQNVAPGRSTRVDQATLVYKIVEYLDHVRGVAAVMGALYAERPVVARKQAPDLLFGQTGRLVGERIVHLEPQSAILGW